MITRKFMQNLRNTIKGALRIKFITLNTFVRKNNN